MFEIENVTVSCKETLALGPCGPCSPEYGNCNPTAACSPGNPN